MWRAFKQFVKRLQVAEVGAELRTFGCFKLQSQVCIFFLVFPGSPRVPTPLPIKIRSRNLAVSFVMGGDSTKSHRQSPLLDAALQSLDSGFFPRKDGQGLFCCLRSKASSIQQECGPGREAINKIMRNTHNIIVSPYINRHMCAYLYVRASLQEYMHTCRHKYLPRLGRRSARGCIASGYLSPLTLGPMSRAVV